MKAAQWNPFNGAQFATYGEAVNLYEIENSYDNKKNVVGKKKWSVPGVTCLEWRPSNHEKLTIACGTTQGSVVLLHTDSDIEVPVCSSNKFGKRCCNTVSWNPLLPTQLAVGFDNIKSEYCALLWDFAHETTLKMSFGESVSSLAWLPDSVHTLLIGTAMGWIKVYDTRIGSQSATHSIMAHPAPRPRKTRGVKVDPFHSSIFCSYSDSQGDAVKIWDIRKVSGGTNITTINSISSNVVNNNKSTIPLVCSISMGNLMGSTSRGNVSQESVLDAAWSPTSPNILAIATNNSSSIAFYSINHLLDSPNEEQSTVPLSTASPIQDISVGHSVRSLSWQGLLARIQCTAKERIENDELPVKGDLLFQSMHGNINAWESFIVGDDLKDMAKSTNTFYLAGARENSISSSCRPNSNRKEEETLPDKFDSHRLLAALEFGFADVNVDYRMPVALSTGGILATASHGSVLVSGKNSYYQEEQIWDNNLSSDAVLRYYFDYGQVMRRRCCAGYEVDASGNIDILSDELDGLFSILYSIPSARDESALQLDNSSKEHLKHAAINTLSIYRTWVWIDRYDTISNEILNETGFDVWKGGILQILQRYQPNTFCRFHNTLGTKVYTSVAREWSKKLCGWVRISGLDLVLTNAVENRQSKSTILRKNGSSESVLLDGDESISSNERKLWSTSDDADLLDVIVDELFMDNFERAAAVALFHGRIDLAVKLLRDAIDKFHEPLISASSPLEKSLSTDSKSIESKMDKPAGELDWDEPKSSEYMQTVYLVAMCIAGYNFPAHSQTTAKENNISWPNTWISMCELVMAQLKGYNRQAAAYLSACCYFLLYNLKGMPDNIADNNNELSEILPYQEIIDNPKMALEDRIAFSTTYLNDEDVNKWLISTQIKCISEGNLEGIMISGLSNSGIDVLQRYIDEHDDIQTAALLVCRSIETQQLYQSHTSNNSFHTENSRVLPIECRWLHEYRTLLNKWELFMERANLDVELGKRARRAAKSAGLPSSSSSKSLNQGQHYASRGQRASANKQHKSKERSSKADRTIYRIPPHSDYPHFYLRCGSCGVALPVDAMQNVRPEALRTQKNVLNCCASCGKAYLPKCYVCLLPMGMINPYVDLQRVQNQRRKISESKTIRSTTDKRNGALKGQLPLAASGSFNTTERDSKNSGSSDNIATNSHNDDYAIDFGKWFFFCQHCRHGGHTECIEKWWGSATDGNDCTGAAQRFICGVNGCNCQCINRI